MATAPLEHFANRLVGCLAVIHSNRHIQWRVRDFHRFHHRNTRLFNHIDGFRGVRSFTQNQTINAIRQQHGYLAFFNTRVIPRVRKQDIKTRWLSDGFNPFNQRRENLIG